MLQAFAALSEPDREALRLVAWEGLSLADGARAAGVTRIAFAVRVSRARRRLAAAPERTPRPLTPGARMSTLARLRASDPARAPTRRRRRTSCARSWRRRDSQAQRRSPRRASRSSP